MKFIELARVFERLEATTLRLEMMDIITNLFNTVKDPDEAAMVSYLLLGEIHPPYIGLELGMSEKLIVRAIGIASGYSHKLIDKRLSELGDIGKTAEEFISRRRQATLFPQELSVKRVYETLDKISRVSGEGAMEEKIRLLAGLLVDSKPIEARYIARITDGTLRLGVADMTLLEALAKKLGSRDYKPILEDAYNKVPDIGYIVKVALSGGIKEIKKIDIRIGIPIRPMLAERVKSPDEAWEKTDGKLAAEYKYDGERMQIHRDGDLVKIFSRRLEDITYQFPDVVDMVKKYIRAEKVIFEGEAIAVNPDTGEYRPFQDLMRRKRKYDIDKMVKEIPVVIRAFDLLYLNGENLLKRPFPERRRRLEEIIVENDYIKPSEIIYPKNIRDLSEFFHKAVEEGCEGLLIKNTSVKSIYQAGARGWLWIKLKRDYRAELSDTVDLVIVGALYGRGRKGGILSSFLMAVYDDDNDVFKTVCKVGTGFKDDDLAYLNKIIKPYIRDRRPPRVDAKTEPDHWIEPAIVLEISAAEITLSPIHTCGYNVIQEATGLALRFPRFTGRYRMDKKPEDATTEKELIEMFKMQRRIIAE